MATAYSPLVVMQDSRQVQNLNLLLRNFPAISKMLKSVNGMARSVIALLALMGVSIFDIGNGLLNKMAGIILMVINNRFVRYFHQGVGNVYQNNTLRVILKLAVMVIGLTLLRKYLWARYVKYWQTRIKSDVSSTNALTKRIDRLVSRRSRKH